MTGKAFPWHGAARAAAPLIAALAAACSTLPPAPSAERSYSGRFSMAVTPSAGGEARSAWSGRFSLVVGTRSLVLDLVSPLGATLARIETDPDGARLLVPSAGGIRTEHGADAQDLALQVLGWPLPVNGLSDWIEGRPMPGRPFRALAPDAGAERFEQDGWAIRVEAAAGDGGGRRVQMDRVAQGETPAVALRVVIDGPAS